VRETDHSPLSAVDVKSGGAIPALPHTSSWQDAQLIKLRNKFNEAQRHEGVWGEEFEALRYKPEGREFDSR
jgi:hypothetical protein